MVAGTYISTCGVNPNKTSKETQITGTGMIFPDKTAVDLTGIETILTLSQQPDRDSTAIEFGYFGGGKPAVGAAGWDRNRIFRRAVPPVDCSVNDETPPTMIEKPFSISRTMLAPVQGLYRMLPINSCTYDNDRKNDKPIEFSIDGLMIRMGDMQWNLGADSEVVSLLGFDLKNSLTPTYLADEPGFLLEATQGNHKFSLYYKRNKEISFFSAIEINKSMTLCKFDMRSTNL